MFYEDVRALKQLHSNALEESTSEVSPMVLLEISALTLRCASRWLAAEQSYVWSRALDTWNQRGKVFSAMQNIVCGGTYFQLEERKEILQKAAEDAYLTLFRIEELLVDIGKLQSEETARKSLATARINVPPGATPIRRTESTAGALAKATKNWMTIVFHARETVWKALDIELDRQMIELVFRRTTFTQNAATRAFVNCVLNALSKPRPGSFTDFRSPSPRYMFSFTRTKQQETLLQQILTSPSGMLLQQQQQQLSPITSAFSSTQLQFQIPFWDNFVVRGIRYASFVGFWFASFAFVRRLSPMFFPNAIESTRVWFMSHLLEPFESMVQELFFNRRPRQSAKIAAAESQESLRRMLDDYRRDRGLAMNVSDLSDVSRAFEQAIKNPLKETVAGDLPRLVLIQAQSVKTETLNLADELDDVIAENHFNSQLLATVPALGILSFSFKFLSRAYRWARNESNSRESARLDLRLALWDVQMLLIREDDGPALFSFLTSDDRGSETGGSENWGQQGPGVVPGTPGNVVDLVRKSSLGSNPAGNAEVFDFEDEDLLQTSQYVDESLTIDPVTKYRRQMEGQMICTLHHVINLLIRSRAVLFRGRDREWCAAMRDANFLFAREGWTARARLELARNLLNQIQSMENSLIYSPL